MSNFAASVFRSFVREVIRTKPQLYHNKKGVIQSSVGLIFKLYSTSKVSDINEILSASYDKIELLFTQRAGYQGDRNAYNVVFPGGQCDGNESDLQACKRELHQQIKLNVEEQCIYIGQLPSNFYYMQKRGFKVYISCHIWCMKQDQLKWKEQLSKDELRDSKWVSYAEIIKDQNYVEVSSVKLGIIERMSSKYRIVDNIGKHIQAVKLPELKLGMDRNLWGLTLWIWSYALQMGCRNLVDGVERVGRQQQASLESCIESIKKLDVEFKGRYILKYPVLGGVKLWHQLYRVKPFTYSRNPSSPVAAKVLMLLAVTCIIWLVMMR